MACELNLEYCTRSSGCANCPHNIGEQNNYIGSIEWQQENDQLYRELQEKKRLEDNYFVTEILSQCVVPLLNVDGVGFFIKDHFVTCGHCLLDGYVKIFHQGKELIFKKEDAIIFHTIDTQSEDEQYGDVAIFPTNESKHCLKIGMEPDEFHYSIFDKSLWIVTYQHKSIENPNTTNSPLFSSSFESYELKLIEAKELYQLTVKSDNSYHTNFFEVTTDKVLGPGVSGSPIFNENNEVLGLLVGCRNPDKSPRTILFHPLYRYMWSLGNISEDIQ